MKNVAAIVMAAGLGKRMRSKLAKVLHSLAGQPMISYMATLAKKVTDSEVVIVIGYQADQVEAYLTQIQQDIGPIKIARQTRQAGTGDAVKQAKSCLRSPYKSQSQKILILNGDTPLLTQQTVQRLLAYHDQKKATITLLTADFEEPRGYGRIVRGKHNHVVKVIEDRDATQEEQSLKEVNVGTYVVDSNFLFRAVEKLQPHNAQGEYYLTDIIAMAVNQGSAVVAQKTEDPTECIGINTREHLARADGLMRQRIRKHWLLEGVTMVDPETVWIDADVRIGRDTQIYPLTFLEGNTEIGNECIIRSGCRISDSRIQDRVTVEDFCVLEETILEEGASVGPFARIRPGSVVRAGARVGNFVELKKVDLGAGSKANHLSYLGDAEIGQGVNIGAGTITCNYDGFKKEKTVIKDHVFIGSDSQLIAPVTIGKGAVVAAGSTVTQNVPEDSLAISRTAQINRTGAAGRRRVLNSGSNGNLPKKKKTSQIEKKGKNVVRPGHRA